MWMGKEAIVLRNSVFSFQGASDGWGRSFMSTPSSEVVNNISTFVGDAELPLCPASSQL
jgi:hypothetical protein